MRTSFLRDGDGTRRPPRKAAFTMVEVALSLGVIAIALVAIIGIMPTGLRVQQENRQDTILNQDGTWLLETLRSGREAYDRTNPVRTRSADAPNGVDFLTNQVLAVALTNRVDGELMFVNPYLVPSGRMLPFGRLGANPTRLNVLTNGVRILGLLGRPKYELREGVLVTNYVAAVMRSISGPAYEKGTVGADLAFSYLVTSEIVPMGNVPREWIDYEATGLTAEEVRTRKDRWLMSLNQGENFSDIRLVLNGPLGEARRNGVLRWESFGTAKAFRTLVSGRQFSYLFDASDQRSLVSYFLAGGFRRIEQ